MATRSCQVHICGNVPAAHPIWSEPFLRVGKELKLNAVASAEFFRKTIELDPMLSEYVVGRESPKDGLEGLDDEFC
jgi:hypothetical protein